MRTLLAAVAVLSLAYVTLAQPGVQPAPLSGTGFAPPAPGTQPGGVPPLHGVAPAPGELPPGSALDQALAELRQIRAQKAELLRREEAVTQQVKRLLETLQKDANTLGIEPKEQPLKAAFPDAVLRPSSAEKHK